MRKERHAADCRNLFFLYYNPNDPWSVNLDPVQCDGIVEANQQKTQQTNHEHILSLAECYFQSQIAIKSCRPLLISEGNPCFHTCFVHTIALLSGNRLVEEAKIVMWYKTTNQ